MLKNADCGWIAAIPASLSVTRSLYIGQLGAWNRVSDNTRDAATRVQNAAGRNVVSVVLAFLRCLCLADTLQFHSNATRPKTSLKLNVDRQSQRKYHYAATKSGSPVTRTSTNPNARQSVVNTCLVDTSARNLAGTAKLKAMGL